MKKRFSDEQIISILREAESGVFARELCRKHAISDAAYYTWRKKFDGMEMPEGKRLVRTVLIFTESSDQLSRATDRVPGLPASPGYVQ
ncbi:transposase [Escherichia coli]|nr:transposase [Escherichia coli]EFA6054190.1 transposase [Escherichia coli]